MRCPVCHKENPSEARACEFCRTPLPDGNSRLQATVPVSGVTVGDAGYEPDSLIAGRYLVVRELGRGGMGLVYLVKDQKLHEKEMALKLISADLTADPQARERFVQEVLAAQDLTHPNVVKVFHLDEANGQSFFTMEYLPGRSLREFCDERFGSGRTFSLRECAGIVLQVLDALDHAHSQSPPVIHRDIKPDNVMVLGDLKSPRVKVLDFGLAKLLSPSKQTTTAMTMGTAYYMAPEQMQGAKDIDQRADLYSVGVIIYEMVTGQIPSGRFELPSEVDSALPVSLDAVIDTALQQHPGKRYATAMAMRGALDALLMELDVAAANEELRRKKELDTQRRAVIEATRQAEEFRRKQEESRRKDEDDRRRLEAARRKSEEEAKRKPEVSATSKPKMASRFKTVAGWTMMLAAFAFLALILSERVGFNGKIWRDPVTDMEFVWIPGGCYLMGSAVRKEDEKPVHEVCVDGFWMGRFRVKPEEWTQIMGKKYTNEKTDLFPEDVEAWREPLVSWNDAQKFIAKLNSKGNHEYRLPTEAEWEYAFRNCGQDETLSRKEDIYDEYEKSPRNKVGLYDMCYDIREWCDDVYLKNAYSFHSKNNPVISSGGSKRVIRGSSCNNEIGIEVSSDRIGLDPDYQDNWIGFRLVRKS